jgi:hypothetical protein
MTNTVPRDDKYWARDDKYWVRDDKYWTPDDRGGFRLRGGIWRTLNVLQLPR